MAKFASTDLCDSKYPKCSSTSRARVVRRGVGFPVHASRDAVAVSPVPPVVVVKIRTGPEGDGYGGDRPSSVLPTDDLNRGKRPAMGRP